MVAQWVKDLLSYACVVTAVPQITAAVQVPSLALALLHALGMGEKKKK